MPSSLLVSFSHFQPTIEQPPPSATDVQRVSSLKDYCPELCLLITGLPCSDYVGYVEDDLYEILSAYMQVEAYVKEGKYGKQSILFGQGGLVINAEIHPERSTIRIERSPHLNKHLTTHHDLDVSTKDYLNTWRDVLHTLVQYCNSLEGKR